MLLFQVKAVEGIDTCKCDETTTATTTTTAQETDSATSAAKETDSTSEAGSNNVQNPSSISYVDIYDQIFTYSDTNYNVTCCNLDGSSATGFCGKGVRL